MLLQGLLGIALFLSVYLVPYLPTGDGPEHVFLAHVENHYGDPGTVYADQLRPLPQFAAKGFSLLYAPLEATLPWALALRLTLGAIVAATGLLAARIPLALDRRRHLAAFLTMGVAVHWHLYMGFFSFCVGLALGLGLLALALRREPGRVDLVVLVAGSIVQSVAHVFSAMLTTPLVALVLVLRAPSPERRRAMGAAAAILGPVALVAAGTLLFVGNQTEIPLTAAWRWETPRAMLRMLPALVAPGGKVRGVAVLALVALSIALLLRDARRRARPAPELGLGIAAVLLLGVGVLGPADVPGWQFVSPRFLTLGVVLALATLPTERWSFSAGALGGALGATLALASIAASGWLGHRLYRACQDVLDPLDAPVRLPGVHFPLVMEPYCSLPEDPAVSPVPYLAPARHIGALYATALGGSVPGLFVGIPSLHSFGPRQDARSAGLPAVPLQILWAPELTEGFRTDPTVRAWMLTQAAIYGQRPDAILLFGGSADDVGLFTELGFDVTWARAALTILQFRGCAAELAVAGVSPTGQRKVAFGVSQFTRPLFAPMVDFDALPAGPMRLPTRLCGRWWARIGTADEAICANADSTGRIHATISPASPTMVCRRP